MEPLLLALIVAAALVGATGTWSPCGLSMIETIGPAGHPGGRPTTLAATAAFAPFAVLGGILTFGLLAAVGSLLAGAGGGVAYLLAAAVALLAAWAEIRGKPIVPQVRRQLPVRWRSTVPMPLAAGGYGILLGLGFTTFVLSYGVWALMGISLLLGDPLAGVAVGAAFGAGRALPIVVLAPIADRPAGQRACDAMVMKPGFLRGARVGDGVALAAVAAVLVGSTGSAGAARSEQPRASDPSAAGPALAYERRDGIGILEVGGERTELPGGDPAVGGPWVAVTTTSGVRILERKGLEAVGSIDAGNADALAVSRKWLSYRVRRGNKDVLIAARLNRTGRPGRSYRLAQAKSPAQLSRPAVDRRRVVYAVAKKGKSSLVSQRLRAARAGPRQALVASRSNLIAGPSLKGKRIAYALTSRKAQTIRVKGLGRGKGRSAYRRGTGPPTLWTTAIAGERIYFTLVKKGGTGRLLSTGR
jgi:hypothetical protein